ncbi:MAG: hypothetical protein JWL87_709 [Candidatus Adlerbacteria bacterium]|nr:hypothetical protein [Candidatus Adlerbacteria bacterium]
MYRYLTAFALALSGFCLAGVFIGALFYGSSPCAGKPDSIGYDFALPYAEEFASFLGALWCYWQSVLCLVITPAQVAGALHLYRLWYYGRQKRQERLECLRKHYATACSHPW